jgi:hypothetical protein
LESDAAGASSGEDCHQVYESEGKDGKRGVAADVSWEPRPSNPSDGILRSASEPTRVSSQLCGESTDTAHRRQAAGVRVPVPPRTQYLRQAFLMLSLIGTSFGFTKPPAGGTVTHARFIFLL